MHPSNPDRRNLLKALGTAGLLSAIPSPAEGLYAAPAMQQPAIAHLEPVLPTASIRFAVIGLDHNHIYGITAAVIRGGGKLVAVYANQAGQVAEFLKQFPGTQVASSEAQILEDPSIQLVASAGINYLRAPLGIRVMRHGKDFLSDKPAITTLEQLAEVRKTIAETGRIFGILFSERLEGPAAVDAGHLVHSGAMGKVIQTVNIAPHKINPATRPEWFWDYDRFGGILCDIGSHQADQFVHYTGSTKAEVTASQVANVHHPDKPKFQDFGDMMLHGNGGFGYVRVDWFTPDGLGVWGDGRLFLLGTEGYIELRKYIDVQGRPGGNHLFLVDGKGARYIDCGQVPLPFGPQFVADVVNRTHIAQDQTQALLATELVLTAQKQAKVFQMEL